MDIRFRSAEANTDEMAALDAIGLVRVNRDTRSSQSGQLGRSLRHLLLPGLHALNDRVGWISEGGLNELCRRLMVPPADAYGVATFYGLFALTERPRRTVWICEDAACQIAGVPHYGADGDDVRMSPCLGLCERAPAVLAIEAGETPTMVILAPATVASLAAARVADTLDMVPAGVSVPQQGDSSLVLLARVGVVDPSSIDAYRAAGGFEALRVARELGPARVIREVLDAGLLGRGGAAFPAGRKWDAVARNPARPHYLVCNADESEPGTFKDRVLMEGDPFAVIETIVIAAYATGCEKAYIYLRGEYPVARQRLQHAIEQVRARGLSNDVDIEVFRGAGAYICGEETAIFNSIEGFRGEPRSKPPFPVDVGLFGAPTLVNNVETLVNVLPILQGGGRAFARVGTKDSAGTKLFCVSGKVERAGVYEIEMGTSLGDLLAMAGAGARGEAGAGASVRAVLLGGAAGSFVGPEQFDMALSFEGARAAGASLGSGVVIVLDESVDVGAIVRRLAAFFRDESCGQCVPCRVGTVRQDEALERLHVGRTIGSADTEESLLADLAQVMRDASICGLGQTAATAVQSALRLFGRAVLERTRP